MTPESRVVAVRYVWTVAALLLVCVVSDAFVVLVGVARHALAVRAVVVVVCEPAAMPLDMVETPVLATYYGTGHRSGRRNNHSARRDHYQGGSDELPHS
ncbi:hypothetical protein R4F53_00605 [Mycobacterium intracellulare]|uniref:Uncharacterized protein n=1 Tax=Mycobacterium intracellulare TaxID=1767 RepID=A0AAE4RAR8_MYCIT|nr:hypothetical protein [Mycobacterium intracellulare]MDV6975315.1 hypothetical protein [Mycobacterium intracellulare]MDV6980379.1 hypothetical protein [Mycobacterium intracellulare]MDV7010808.1 hypothetical protein [Mycobacterium intracellulare]MDV7025714.1 hypothetical protein [Mycobacterium intracellulare]